MPNAAEATSSQPELSEVEKAQQALQGQLISLAADEARTNINKFIYVYGLNGDAAVWALYSAMTSTLARLQPQMQPKVMEAMLKAMQKKLDGLSGKPPEAPPEAENADA